MKGKKLLITLALAIRVFVPISGQCDPPKIPNDGWFLDEEALLGVPTSDPDEPNSYAEFNLDSLHVAAWLLGGGFVGLLLLARTPSFSFACPVKSEGNLSGELSALFPNSKSLAQTCFMKIVYISSNFFSFLSVLIN